MQEASITGFFKVILIILIVYYGLKIIGRFAFPLMMKKFMSKLERKFQEQQGQGQQRHTSTKVGETVIDKKPNSDKRTNDTVGEYVDYEDVD